MASFEMPLVHIQASAIDIHSEFEENEESFMRADGSPAPRIYLKFLIKMSISVCGLLNRNRFHET